MTAPADPRLEPGWKQKRYEERYLAMLGAILDAVKANAPQPPAPAQQRRKKEDNGG